MSVDCKKCVHYADQSYVADWRDLICHGCIHWSELHDNYHPITYRHLCSVCGYWWEDESSEGKEYCPQCKHKMEELNV